MIIDSKQSDDFPYKKDTDINITICIQTYQYWYISKSFASL